MSYYTRPHKFELVLMKEEIKRRKSTVPLLLDDVAIEDRPTQITEAMRPVITQPLPALEFAVEPISMPEPQTLPRDSQGRPFIQVNNPYEHTHDLVDALVTRYYELTGVYPTIILLSALRYLTVGMPRQHYYSRYTRAHGVVRIPFDYDGSVSYDVLCRGE